MSNKKLIAACKLWDKATEKMNKKAYPMPKELDRWKESSYSSEDYPELQCRVDGDKAELTLGMSVGHKAHINLADGTLRYYDLTYSVNEIMKRIFESVEGTHKGRKERQLLCQHELDGISCKHVNELNVSEVFKTLAMPTSMDFRLASCHSSREAHQEGTSPEEHCKDAEVKFFMDGPRKEK